MQITPKDLNPANNSSYGEVLALQKFLSDLYIHVDIWVTNYQMAQQDRYDTSYYQNVFPDCVGNFMVRGNVGQQLVNVANFKRNLTGYTSNLEKLRAIHSLFLGGDFYGWLLNFDWFREAIDHIVGVRLDTIK